MKVLYAAPCYDRREVDAATAVLWDPRRLGANRAVAEFERKIAEYHGKAHSVMVNSGSSANLLALASVRRAGAEVITPALTFATTVAPIIQLGMRPVFVDVDRDTLQVDVDQVEAAITGKTVALMIPLLLGNVPDMDRLEKLAALRGLTFISDECDTLGGTYNWKPPGHYSHISTTSFFATHVITCAGGGGAVSFRSIESADRARLRTYWGRASTLYGSESEDIAKRLDDRSYDAKFLFTELGYNLQPLEVQGAFGLEQLKRLPDFIEARKVNWARLRVGLEDVPGVRTLRQYRAGAEPVWLAFPFFVAENVRGPLVRHLEERGVQTRPIMAGNILRQPAFAEAGRGAFPVADEIMKTGVLVGCHPGLTEAQIDFVTETVTEFMT